MSKFWIGTAGWSYEDWNGAVYPPGLARRIHPLTFLAQYIDFIEVNSTFYRPIAASLTMAWLKKVEDFKNFMFALKCHQVFTHQRKGFGQKDVDDFRRAAEPMKSHERLAAVLLQFPWSFAATPANRDYLAKLLPLFPDLPLAVEVRHGSWNSRGFLEFLKERKAAFCNIDQPLFRNSIEPSAVSTRPDFSYVRLHGRNAKDWFREGAGRDDRYNYLYAKDELREWVDRIKQLGQKTGKVYVVTNNHYRGQAMANALQIKNMITGDKVDIPAILLEQYPVLEEIVRKIERGQRDLFDDKEGSS